MTDVRFSRRVPGGEGTTPHTHASKLMKAPDAVPAPDARRQTFLQSARSCGDLVKARFLEATKQDSKIVELKLDADEQRLFRMWPANRKEAAVRLLCDAPRLEVVSLPGCGLHDETGEAFAELLMLTGCLHELNLERNDFRAPGLMTIIEALRENRTLTNLHMLQQSTPMVTAVETAMQSALADNSTLQKLGMDFHSAPLKRTVHQKLSMNMDANRVARKKAKELEREKEWLGCAAGWLQEEPATRLPLVQAKTKVHPQQQWWEPLACLLCNMVCDRFCIPVHAGGHAHAASVTG